MTIQEKLYQVRERIQKAASRAQRNPADITLILVTKTVPPDKLREAFGAGVQDFGENRVQELLGKKSELPPEIRWHFVGHLQTNKVKFLLGEMVLLHSLDRIELAQEIQKQAEKKDLRIHALLQVNTTGETTKSGFLPEKVEEALETIKAFPGIRVRGFMTIGPTPQEGKPLEEPIRSSFRKLRSLRDTMKTKFPDMNLEHLSMGMSSDFEIAVEEGATLLRIGTAVFGERQ